MTCSNITQVTIYNCRIFAAFCTRVYDHVLRPLMAPDRPNAPPELTAALGTFDQIVTDHLARARVPAVA